MARESLATPGASRPHNARQGAKRPRVKLQNNAPDYRHRALPRVRDAFGVPGGESAARRHRDVVLRHGGVVPFVDLDSAMARKAHSLIIE